jgi:hypothetical protein
MNWFHFLSWVAGLYLLYYLSLILFDVSQYRTVKVPESGELTFSEDIPPKKIWQLPDKTGNPPEPVQKTDSAIIASGGVSLKNLFGLCREEAVIYTRPVSF